MKLITADAFRTAARRKKPSQDGVFRVSTVEPKAYDDSSRKIRFCFSDSSVDRMGDRIMADGWSLHGFLKNPVALFAHDSSAPPIGRASNVMVEDDRLMGDIEFMGADIYPFAETIYQMVKQKFLNAVSVGFLPKDYEWADEDEPGREWGIDFLQQELLEISVVPVPANGNALVDARAKGIDTRPLVEWAEKALAGGGKLIVSRAEIERLRKAAKEPASARRPRGARRDGEPMSETDPAAGGAVLGSCGRDKSEECGMKNAAECSVHCSADEPGEGDTMDDKAIAEIVRRELAASVPGIVKDAVTAALKAAKPPRRRDTDPDPDPEPGGTAEGEDRPEVGEEHEKNIRMAHMHMKAMGDCLDLAEDHHDKAMDALEDVVDALNASPPSDDGLSGGEDPEAKAARQRAMSKVRKLRAA